MKVKDGSKTINVAEFNYTLLPLHNSPRPCMYIYNTLRYLLPFHFGVILNMYVYSKYSNIQIQLLPHSCKFYGDGKVLRMLDRNESCARKIPCIKPDVSTMYMMTHGTIYHDNRHCIAVYGLPNLSRNQRQSFF